MKLGLIARADSRGLGIQCKSFFDHLHPAKTMVVDCPSAQPLPLRKDWYPGATWIHGLPTRDDFRTWLQDIDVVYTAETAYGPWLWTEAKRAGVKTVLHANWEFLNPADQPDLWLAPSMWHFNDFPAPKRFLPVPVDTDRFTPQPAHDGPRRFLHIVGRPAVHDRNGSADLFQALRHVTADIELTVKCQQPGYVTKLAQHIPPNVKLRIDEGDVPNYWDNYQGDVLIMPRRFGGLCLPVNEALAAGMPVIMPNISPNEWLPAEWLVDAGWCATFRAKQRVDIYSANHKALAAKIDQFTNTGFYTAAKAKATDLAKGLSWNTLLPEYHKLLQQLSPS